MLCLQFDGWPHLSDMQFKQVNRKIWYCTYFCSVEASSRVMITQTQRNHVRPVYHHEAKNVLTCTCCLSAPFYTGINPLYRKHSWATNDIIIWHKIELKNEFTWLKWIKYCDGCFLNTSEHCRLDSVFILYNKFLVLEQNKSEMYLHICRIIKVWIHYCKIGGT